MKFIKPKIKQRMDFEDASHCYYHKWFFIREVYFNRLKAGLKYLPSSKQRILEIGVGSGILLPSLDKNSSDVYGVDYREDFVKKAEDFCRKNRIKANLTRAEATNLPYDDNFFDAAICLSVMEHISDLDDALREAKRVIKPGGIFVVGVPIERFLVNTLFKIFGYAEEVKDYHINDYIKVREALKNHFTIEKSYKIPFNILPDSLSLYLVVKCRNNKN